MTRAFFAVLLFATSLEAVGESRVYIELNLSRSDRTLDSYGTCWYEAYGIIQRYTTFRFRHWIHLADNVDATIADSGDSQETGGLVLENRQVGTGAYSTCYRSRFKCQEWFGTNQEVGTAQQCVPDEPEPPTEETQNSGGGGSSGCTNCTGGGGSGGWTPIIINRKSGEFRLTNLEGGVEFRIDRERERTSWTHTDSPHEFLWLDRNGDGSVNDASELFGSSSPLQSGQRATHGFDALSELDWNRDQRIDSADPAWPHLRLWRDANHNGVSESNELSRLNASGVEALELNFRTINRRDAHGNLLRYESMLVMTGNVRRPYYDVLLVREGV